MHGIRQYDTVKDKSGKRFRVTETKNDGTGHIVATLKGINPDGSARRGMPRRVRLDVLESEYTRINLAPVEVKKIDDLRKEETKVTQVPAPHVKAAQIEKEAVRELSKKDIEKAVEVSTFGGTKKPGETNDAYKHRMNREITEVVMEAKRRKAENSGQDIEILKAELKDRVRENIDLKKTISKMQQQHEAEVADLKDRIMEAEAEANAAKKRKEEILKERTEYADALDDDSVAFEEILRTAETIQLVSTATAKLAKQIIAKTEGRI